MVIPKILDVEEPLVRDNSSRSSRHVESSTRYDESGGQVEMGETLKTKYNRKQNARYENYPTE